MKLTISILAAAVLLLGALGAVTLFAAAEPKENTVTVKGEVVDLYCYLSVGAMGEKHKECAVTCAKAGNPIGLVTEKGVAYILMGKDMANPMRDKFIEKMASTITVKGKVVEKGGLKGIQVESIE
ncbi:MAG: hypothetical protein ACE15C_17670 [Phycisphaerae bacterium]